MDLDYWVEKIIKNVLEYQYSADYSIIINDKAKAVIKENLKAFVEDCVEVEIKLKEL